MIWTLISSLIFLDWHINNNTYAFQPSSSCNQEQIAKGKNVSRDFCCWPVPVKLGINSVGYRHRSTWSFLLWIIINLLVVYRESVNLIGYITRRLSADSLQLWIANETRLFWARDVCFTPQCTSRAVFETFELPM